MEFSKAKMKEVFKEETDKRVSEESAHKLADILETYGGQIAEKAIKIAEEKGRRTVRAEDIREAMKD